MLSVIMLNVFILSVVMLNVLTLTVAILNVVAPLPYKESRECECR